VSALPKLHILANVYILTAYTRIPTGDTAERVTYNAGEWTAFIIISIRDAGWKSKEKAKKGGGTRAEEQTGAQARGTGLTRRHGAAGRAVGGLASMAIAMTDEIRANASRYTL
jgi:hypothetical protein